MITFLTNDSGNLDTHTIDEAIDLIEMNENIKLTKKQKLNKYYIKNKFKTYFDSVKMIEII